MAERATIARPYARAAFAAAREDRDLAGWSRALQAAAAFAADARVEQLITSPNVAEDALVDLMSDAGGRGGEALRNFIRLLARNRRLSLLPDISAQFEVLRSEVENTAMVEITSAVPLSDGQKSSLAAALHARLKRQIQVQATVDPDLLGGAVIRCGDLVIDGSVRGRLAQLQNELSN